jgi:hypothetical protein
MIGVIVIAVLNVAMFAWFFYLAAKDPSNVFKRRRPPAVPSDEVGDGAENQDGADQPPQG